MKKNLLLVVVFAVILVVSACGPSSEKGNWTDSDKKAMREGLEKQDLSHLGENKDAFLDCCISKMEENYTNISEASDDATGLTNISAECAQSFAEGE